MENRGLLTLKEVNGVASVTSVQRVHELFKGIKVQNPESLRAGKEDDKKDKDKGNGKISLIELYKFSKKMKYVRASMHDLWKLCSVGSVGGRDRIRGAGGEIS